jgi:uncharacterized protein (DUF1330 family)
MNVNWKKYFTSKSTSIDSYLSKYGFKFLEQTSHKIKRAIQHKTPYIILIKFRNSEIISILKEEEYELALNLLLKLCIRLEYYEICSQIDKTLKQIKKDTITKSTKYDGKYCENTA